VPGGEVGVEVRVDHRLDGEPAGLRVGEVPESAQMNERVIEALAGPGADRAAVIRAQAAFGVVKNATAAAMSIDPAPEGDAKLAPADRAEILDAALRALNA